MIKKTKKLKGKMKKTRTPIKRGKNQESDNVLITSEDNKNIKQFELVAEEIKTNLTQLKHRIAADIKVIKKATKPIHILRASKAIGSAPNLIYCNNNNYWQDILCCEYACNAKCSKYLSSRYLCVTLNCDPETRQRCVMSHATCNVFRIYQRYQYKYINAYAKLHTLRKEELGVDAINGNINKKRRRKQH